MAEKENKDNVVIERVQAEINKIDKKENTIYFFVLDTKGNPSGSLEYIYKLAYLLNTEGYNVSMLYQEDEEFIGVGEWLGEEYASLKHENIASETTSVAPSDILFIPEIFSNVMAQAKQLPCKKIAIFQNYDYISEQIPLSVQWGDYNILDAIVNTDENANLLKTIFPYVKSHVITPYIDGIFYDIKEPKKMIINIVSKNPSNINRIIKPFYWAYPTFKWVTFRDLRGFSKKDFADKLREAAMTIWIDDDTNFGYSALEAMKSGSMLLAKLPDNQLPWITNENGELTNGCIWFDNIHQLPKLLAQLVRAWVTNSIPENITKEGKDIASQYTKEQTKTQIVDYVKNVIDKRKQELNNLILAVKGQVKHKSNES